MYFGPSLIIQINFNLESQSINIVWWFIIIIVDSDSLDGYIFNITDILCELHLLYELIYLLMIEKIWAIQYFWKKSVLMNFWVLTLIGISRGNDVVTTLYEHFECPHRDLHF